MPESSAARGSHLGATRREGERVTPWSFLDLVFVLAITSARR